MVNFLPSITCITKNGWRDKVKEIDSLGISSAAVFVTCIDKKERTELFAALEKTNLKKIPFLHLRSDVDAVEMEYFINHWGAEVFNIHSLKEFPIGEDLYQYANKIFIEENTFWPWDEQEIKKFAGICIDFAHLEEARLQRPDMYEKWIKIIEKYPCGCGHVSAILPEPTPDQFDHTLRYDHHILTDLSQMNYLTQYPPRYFPKYVAIELENSLSKQLQIQRYIAKLLNL